MENIARLTRFRVVSNDAEKEAALRDARDDGFRWVSSSIIELENGRKDQRRYRMRFIRDIKNGRR